ncbi:MAG: TIGR03667 family PPOX class F420-dependent oxidoreductase [Anaerolineales bacterium]
MFDLTTEFGQRVNQQLKNEELIWLTTVTPAGVAQPNPVWFYWDGHAIIIYSQPASFRIRNIQHNPRVTLNLQGADVLGNNVVVIQGTAQLNDHYTRPHPGYETKYSQYLPEMSLTFKQLVAEFSVEIIITPSGLRGN